MFKVIFFVLVFENIPLFELSDTIYSFGELSSRFSAFDNPFHYSTKSVTNTRFPFISNLLLLQGQNFASPSIGGTSPEENLVMLNGIPLVNPMIGYQDLCALPLSTVEEVEILHSTSPFTVLPGIGGAVNFISGRKLFAFRWSTYKQSINIGFTPFQNLSVSAFAENFTDSFPVKVEDTKLWITNTKDRKVGTILQTKDKKSAIFLLKREAGAPSPLGTTETGSKTEFLQGSSFKTNWNKVTISVQNFYTSQSYRSSATSDVHRTLFLRNSYTFLNFETGVMLTAAKSTKLGRKACPVIYVNAVPIHYKSERLVTTTFLSTEYSFTSRSIYPSLLHAVAYRLGGHTIMYLNASRNFRNPTFNELYWPEDIFAKGNPDLKPELSNNIDAGIRTVQKKLFVSTNFFIKRIRNGIVWIQGDKYYPLNFSKVVHVGANFEFAGEPSRNLYWECTINFQNSTIDGSQYVYRPPLSVNLFARSGPLHFEVFYLSPRPERPNSTKMLQSTLILNGYVEKEFQLRHIQANLRLGFENFLNTNYEIIRGYPQPGREYFVQVEISRRE